METEGVSLRERKKIQTRAVIWRTAADLFIERGYDNVSVAEVAAAAQVSKMTVFNYVSSKEDLVLGPMEVHIDDAARAVRDRRPGESVVAAVRDQFLRALAEHDASVGLLDEESILRVLRLIDRTPALRDRRHQFSLRAQQLLAEELESAVPGDPHLARVAAAQLMGARNALIDHNIQRLLAGESAAAVQPDAVALAERAFAMVEFGLGEYGAEAVR
ncbi:TetR/AcrR family transcriptional regulator [Streptomyces orinoci]|uniref:TetR family transcriptional regulator n=1 Tax=Streptomyces orinoci TaxID=67339 RepID=A0ABV3K2S5_STRON|nr:TetR family transcriptional regulator [Streptomyces orinoci]